MIQNQKSSNSAQQKTIYYIRVLCYSEVDRHFKNVSEHFK